MEMRIPVVRSCGHYPIIGQSASWFGHPLLSRSCATSWRVPARRLGASRPRFPKAGAVYSGADSSLIAGSPFTSTIAGRGRPLVRTHRAPSPIPPVRFRYGGHRRESRGAGERHVERAQPRHRVAGHGIGPVDVRPAARAVTGRGGDATDLRSAPATRRRAPLEPLDAWFGAARQFLMLTGRRASDGRASVAVQRALKCAKVRQRAPEKGT